MGATKRIEAGDQAIRRLRGISGRRSFICPDKHSQEPELSPPATLEAAAICKSQGSHAYSSRVAVSLFGDTVEERISPANSDFSNGVFPAMEIPESLQGDGFCARQLTVL